MKSTTSSKQKPSWRSSLPWLLGCISMLALDHYMGRDPSDQFIPPKDLPDWITSLSFEALFLWAGCFIVFLIVLIGLYLWIAGRGLEAEWRQQQYTKIKKSYEMEPKDENVHRIP